MIYPIYKFCSSGNQIINLAPANGFPPPVYRPMLGRFCDDYKVISLLPRALWPDQDVPDNYINWKEGLAHDLDQGIDAYKLENLIAIGHSFGGIASILSVIRDPSRFKALILLDPTLMSQEILNLMIQLRNEGGLDKFPLAARALKRRRTFDNYESALAYFKEKALFSAWHPDALKNYVYEGMTTVSDMDDGKSVTMLWPPAWEAYYFTTIYTEIWDDIPLLDGLVPTLVVRGGDTDTFLEDSEAKMRKLVPNAIYKTLEGHGHLFPMTAPDETARFIQQFLKTLSD